MNLNNTMNTNPDENDGLFISKQKVSTARAQLEEAIAKENLADKGLSEEAIEVEIQTYKNKND